MPYSRRIYPLKNLSPEERAVTFAKCSRSPLSFSEIAEKLTQEEAQKFNKKWVIDFGHASIAEHAVVSLAIENVSILATKIIEDTRFGSFTEKSTRYQVFDRDKFYFPPKIENSTMASLYKKTINNLMDFYLKAHQKVFEILKKENKQPVGTTEAFYLSQLKSKACDIVRISLPLATLTNLGMTINARSLAYLIKKFLSHPLEEIQAIGNELKQASIDELPTLVAEAQANEFLKELPKISEELAKKYLKKSIINKQTVELVDYDKDAEEKIITSLIYRSSFSSYQEIYQQVKKISQKEKEEIFEKLLAKRKPMESTPREFEEARYTFDILMDYGAFRDLQRHRVCTQINQNLSNVYGYIITDEIKKYGLEKEFKQQMGEAEKTYLEMVKKFPDEAQYLLPMAFRKRFLLTLNLRELYYLVPLRTSVMGHPSYRQVVKEIYEEAKKVHPILVKNIKILV